MHKQDQEISDRYHLATSDDGAVAVELLGRIDHTCAARLIETLKSELGEIKSRKVSMDLNRVTYHETHTPWYHMGDFSCVDVRRLPGKIHTRQVRQLLYPGLSGAENAPRTAEGLVQAMSTAMQELSPASSWKFMAGLPKPAISNK